MKDIRQALYGKLSLKMTCTVSPAVLLPLSREIEVGMSLLSFHLHHLLKLQEKKPFGKMVK